MKWTNTQSGSLFAAGRTLLGALDNGADAVIDRINAEPDYANRIARFAMNGGREGAPDLRIARIVLGGSLFEAADWVSLFGAKLTKKEWQSALRFPLHEDVLNAPCPFHKGKLLKETHTTFLGIDRLNGKPLTVMRLHEIHPQGAQPHLYFSNVEHPWCESEAHTAEAVLEARWHVHLTETVPGSTGKSSDEQVKLLPSQYEVAKTVAEVKKNFAAFRKTGKRPNASVWARCAEKTSAGNFSIVGYFDENGLYVNNWNGNPNDNVGLAAAWQSSLPLFGELDPAAEHAADFVERGFYLNVFLGIYGAHVFE